MEPRKKTSGERVVELEEKDSSDDLMELEESAKKAAGRQSRVISRSNSIHEDKQTQPRRSVYMVELGSGGEDNSDEDIPEPSLPMSPQEILRRRSVQISKRASVDRSYLATKQSSGDKSHLASKRASVDKSTNFPP